MTVAEWAVAIRLHVEASAARARELYVASTTIDLAPDYRDLAARIRVRLQDLEFDNERMGHDVRNLQQALIADGRG